MTSTFVGHEKRVRSVSVDPTGEWFVTGSDDCTARVWEISSGRCCHIFRFDDSVVQVAWNPNPKKHCIAIAVGHDMYIANASVGTPEMVESWNREYRPVNREVQKIRWGTPSKSEIECGVMQKVTMKSAVTSISWHRQGDYIISVSPKCSQASYILLVHQLSNKRTQKTFKTVKDKIQKAKFHPSRPVMLVSTQTKVKTYNLAKMNQEKKMSGNIKFISGFDIHPKGDNVITCGYDKRICWYDMELSMKPFKNLKYHKQAVRNVSFHPSYPLFASASDDATVHVYYSQVYDDLNKDALIVPVRILRGHTPKDELGVLDLAWHPTQPWLVTAGADGTAKLWT